MKLATQSIRDISEGIIQGVDSAVCPKNSVALACNLVFDKVLGRAVLRNGNARIGSRMAAGYECLGLHQHITIDGNKIPIAVFSGASAPQLFYYNGAWTGATGTATALTPWRFETFLDTTIALNGTDNLTTADGITWVATGGNLDAANIPVQCTVIREFLDKLYAAGDPNMPDRLYSSQTPVSGAISWLNDDPSPIIDYIDVEPEEGAGGIRALAKVPGYLLIFKERSLKRWDGYSTYPESLVPIGAHSQEGVVMARQSVYFFYNAAIYETVGNYPRKISRKIQDILAAVYPEMYSAVSGWGDENNVYFSIGQVTLGGKTYDNAVVAYNIDSQTWTMLNYPRWFCRWHQYVDSGGDNHIVAADSDGSVFEMNIGDYDEGATVTDKLNINWHITFQQQEFGSRGLTKDLSKFVVYTKGLKGTAYGRANERDWTALGSISKDVQVLTKDLHGQYFDITLIGSGRSGEVIGIDFPEIDVNQNYGD